MRSKFFCTFALILLIVSPAFSDSYKEHEKRFEIFYKSVEEVANRISWSGEAKLQDVEFVRNEMNGDERVYQRAWYDDYYVVIRKYNDKKWTKSYISDFSTSSEELTFANGIKVGSPFSKVVKFFGREHIYGSSKIRHVAQYEESDGGAVLTFSVENGTITSIGSSLIGDNKTSKMIFLFDLYTTLYLAEVKGDKINVHDHASNGKVRFQVNQSRKDRLLVNIEESEKDWYQIAGRIVRNKLEKVPYYYISKQFVKVRKLTPSERKSLISQYKK